MITSVIWEQTKDDKSPINRHRHNTGIHDVWPFPRFYHKNNLERFFFLIKCYFTRGNNTLYILFRVYTVCIPCFSRTTKLSQFKYNGMKGFYLEINLSNEEPNPFSRGDNFKLKKILKYEQCLHFEILVLMI